MPLRLCDGMGNLFSAMFPDSQIAANMSVGRDKAGYVIKYGLAPHFHEELRSETNGPFAVAFDESLNKVCQRGQMDVVVRYWDQKANKACSRYWGSGFLGKGASSNLLQTFLDTTTELKLRKVIQLSMDGPNVNWAFNNLLKEHLCDSDPECPTFVPTGSCGLHIVHGALQAGHNATDWNVNSILSSLWLFFKDSPSKRALFSEVTGGSVFPLRFCAHRWVENVPVTDRALTLWPQVLTFLDAAHDQYRKTQAHSYTVLESAARNPLTVPIFHFFRSVAVQLQPFLEKFQSDAPLVPFLSEELEKMLRVLLNRFLKRAVVVQADTALKLSKLDVSNKDL